MSHLKRILFCDVRRTHVNSGKSRLFVPVHALRLSGAYFAEDRMVGLLNDVFSVALVYR